MGKRFKLGKGDSPKSQLLRAEQHQVLRPDQQNMDWLNEGTKMWAWKDWLTFSSLFNFLKNILKNGNALASLMVLPIRRNIFG